LFLNESLAPESTSRIVVVLSILFYISWQIHSFRSRVTLTLLRGANVYRIRCRISVRSIGCAISCAIDTGENVSLGDQFPSLEIYYTRLSHSMHPNTGEMNEN